MRYLLRLSFCLLLLLCATFSTAQTKREPLKLLRVTPAGEDVPLSAQIVFEFNSSSRTAGPHGTPARGSSDCDHATLSLCLALAQYDHTGLRAGRAHDYGTRRAIPSSCSRGYRPRMARP